MFAIQTAIKYTKKNTWRYLFLGVIAFVAVVASVIACRIINAGLSNIPVDDKIELTCDININENGGTGIYTLTVAGYLQTGGAYAERIPPVVFRSFSLVTDGSVESVENISLSMHINGEMETVKYDVAYAVLEEGWHGHTPHNSSHIGIASRQP